MKSNSPLKLAHKGSFINVRGKPWIVEDIHDDGGLPTLKLACISDDSQGEQLIVLYDAEIDANLIDDSDWSSIGVNTADEADVLAAYIRTIRWKSATTTDRELFQAPFRAGIKLDAYQLLPLQKALRLPRTNLLIADDVGLGKTIEAGLIMRELLLRRRIDFMVVSAPPSMTIQWKDELETKFGLTFQIMDREKLRELRLLHGFSVNPWATGSRFIISHRLLTDETYTSGLRDILSEFRAKSLLILDEAHHAAPASSGGWGGRKGNYAISSQLTKAVRELSERFEHRLFLSATPHNGHSNSFSALLEMLDPQRFTRGVKVHPSDLSPVMVRRLKSDLRQFDESFPNRIIEPIVIDNLPLSSPELELSRRLSDFGEMRMSRIAKLPTGKAATSKLIFVNLQRRLLSSITAFKRSLEVHRETLVKLKNKEIQKGLSTKPEYVEPISSDEGAELGFEDEVAEEMIEEDELAKTRNVSIVGSIDSEESDIDSELQAIDEMLVIAQKNEHSPDAKLSRLFDWIRKFMLNGNKWNERRLIIFTEWEDTRRWLERRIGEEFSKTEEPENRIATFTGATGTLKREAIKRNFNTDPLQEPIRILICTDAAREGINLQHYCFDLIHFDLPWNPARLEQRNGRIDRKLQSAKTVTCRYFFYKQRETDIVLKALFDKSDTIQRELGSMGRVIGDRIAHRLNVEGISKGQGKEIADAIISAVDKDQQEIVNSEMGQPEANRKKEVIEELKHVESALKKSQEIVGVDPEDLEEAVAAALKRGGLCLEQKRHKVGDISTYDLGPSDPSFSDDVRWTEVFDELRVRPREKGETSSKWRSKAQIRKISFVTPIMENGRFADDIVQMHLEHRLIRRLLSRFISQGFQSKLSRLSIIEGEGADCKVILMGRLTIYGVGAARLHEEVIPVTANWTDVERGSKPLIPLGKTDHIETLNQLDHALKSAKMSPEHIEKTIKKNLRQDIEDLKPEIERVAKKQLSIVKKELQSYGEDEAKSLEKLLKSQKDRILATIKITESEQLRFKFDQEDELMELEANIIHWENRLREIDKEIEVEPTRLRESYNVLSDRLEPVGIVYLWPRQGK